MSFLNRLHSEKIEGGLTNENFKVTLPNGTYFVRKSGGQNRYLDITLEGEQECAIIAAAHGLAPKMIATSFDAKIMVTEFIDSKPVDLRDLETMRRFCELSRTLHQLKVKFFKTRSPFQIVETYLMNAMELKVSLPPILFREVLPKLYKKKWEIKKFVPCHLDLHKGNLVDDGNRLWMIDWEYAAMSDPLFDLATASAADFFSDEEMDVLLRTYLQREPLKQETEDFFFFRVLTDVRWALWAYIQDKISSFTYPFIAHGDRFLSDAVTRIL